MFKTQLCGHIKLGRYLGTTLFATFRSGLHYVLSLGLHLDLCDNRYNFGGNILRIVDFLPIALVNHTGLFSHQTKKK